MIQILDTPPTFNPVYSDGLFFTISADTTNKFKFRYVYDVEVNGQIVFQAKATPNPNSLGVIDVSKVVKTYTTNNPIALWDTTPIYVHQTFPFSRPYENEVIGYKVYFGYEYSLTPEGFVSGFTGSGSTEGPPSIDSGLYKTFYSTFGVNGRATQQDFNMAPFVMSGTPTGTNPTTSGLFLTNSPRTRDIQESEYYTLAFTNYYLDGSTLSEPYYVEYKFYDEDGDLIQTRQYQNLTTNGGGPLPDCSFVYQSYNLIYPSGNTDYNTLYVAAGPKNFSNPFPANCAQYTIQLFGKFTGTTTPVQPTPTPTPSATPPSPCPVCKEYEVTNNNLLAQCVVGFIGCQSFPQTLVVNPGETFFICACEGSLVYECDLQVIDRGECNPAFTPTPTPTATTPTPTPTATTPTPTPTPTTPCDCEFVTITISQNDLNNANDNNDLSLDGKVFLAYIPCGEENTQFEVFTSAGTYTNVVCVSPSQLEYFTLYYYAFDEPVTEIDSTYVLTGVDCCPQPSPTPTPTSSPTPTPTPFLCECSQVEITNPNEFPILVTGLDCDGNPISIPLNSNETAFTNCICQNTLSSEFPFIDIATFSCETPSPTSTLTPTPTSTLTPTPTPTVTCGLYPFTINECTSTCFGGNCFCSTAGTTTVYMGQNFITPADEGYFLYSDPCLTDIWFGYYEYGGNIYEASQIQFICTVGGPC
jgi:hypothetical protein